MVNGQQTNFQNAIVSFIFSIIIILKVQLNKGEDSLTLNLVIISLYLYEKSIFKIKQIVGFFQMMYLIITNAYILDQEIQQMDLNV